MFEVRAAKAVQVSPRGLALGVDAGGPEQGQRQERSEQHQAGGVAAHQQVARRPDRHAPQEGMAGDPQHAPGDVRPFQGRLLADAGRIGRGEARDDEQEGDQLDDKLDFLRRAGRAPPDGVGATTSGRRIAEAEPGQHGHRGQRKETHIGALADRAGGGVANSGAGDQQMQQDEGDGGGDEVDHGALPPDPAPDRRRSYP